MWQGLIFAMASEQVDWQKLSLGNDESSDQGTKALCFFAEQVRLAQNNPMLRPTLHSLFQAHGLELNDNNWAREPPRIMVNNQGIENLQVNQVVERPQQRSSRSPRRERRPLEQPPARNEEGSDSSYMNSCCKLAVLISQSFTFSV